MAGAEERTPAELGVEGRWRLEAQPLTPAGFGLPTRSKEPPLYLQPSSYEDVVEQLSRQEKGAR